MGNEERTHVSPITPPVFVRFSFKTQTSYNLQRGGYSSPQELKYAPKNLSKSQKKTKQLLRIIIHNTHGPQAIPGTQYSCVPIHIQISADGEAGALDVCVKSGMYIAITANRSPSQPADKVTLKLERLPRYCFSSRKIGMLKKETLRGSPISLSRQPVP